MESDEAALARLLPVRPAPRPGELLASWVGRTAAAYHLPPGRFLRERWLRFPVRSVMGGQRPLWSYPQFPNNLENDPTPKVMAQATGIPESEIKDLRLVHEGRSFIQRDLLVPFGVWCRGGQYHAREFVRVPESYCPECLAQDFYLRRVWRVGLLNVCRDHRRELCEFCPACGGDLDFFGQLLGKHRQPGTRHELPCPSCGFDLVLTSKNSPGQPVSTRFFRFHQFVDDLLFRRLGSVPQERARQMATAFNHLMKRLNWEGGRTSASASHDPARFVREQAGGPSAAMMRRPVRVRLATFRLAYHELKRMEPGQPSVKPTDSDCWAYFPRSQRELLHEMATMMFPQYLAADQQD